MKPYAAVSCLAGLILSHGAAFAAAPSSAGFVNDWLRQDNPYMSSWNLGALYWSRYEMKQNGGFTGPGSLADFRTDTDNDNSYLLQRVLLRGTGYGINPDAGTFVGSEIDLVATWQANKFLVLEAAYCRFLRGDYIQDSLSKVGSQDADYVYVQAQLNF